ncbi:MAG: exodeoxyribonuclease VII small subunit [Butyrivibrio sp.]|nr:exodeoxyribonuclease VII small subunit [Butyrivibrio sp.]
MSIEESFTELNDIIKQLENKDTPLEEAFNRYEQGINLIKKCNDELDRVEKKIIVLQDGEQ